MEGLRQQNTRKKREELEGEGKVKKEREDETRI